MGINIFKEKLIQMKKLNIKLDLNKKKISKLNENQTRKIKGGKTLKTCNPTITIGNISGNCEDMGGHVNISGKETC